jgi:hypothetical protein
MDVIAAVPSALMDCSSRQIVSTLTRPLACADEVAFTLT